MHQQREHFGNALDDPGESESRLQLIVDKTPALIHSARPDGYIDFFNQHCFEFLGLPFEKISGWGWMKTIHADDIEAFLAKWHAAANRFKPLHYRPYLVSTCKMQKDSRNVRSWRLRRNDVHHVCRLDFYGRYDTHT